MSLRLAHVPIRTSTCSSRESVPMPRPSSRVLATACISLLVILLASSLKPHPPQSKPDNVNMVTALKNVIVIGGSYVGCVSAAPLTAP